MSKFVCTYKYTIFIRKCQVLCGKTLAYNINLELWFAKHYHNRDQFEDDDGNRKDIPPTDIEALVTKGLKHLIFYSSVVKGFTFLNHEDYPGNIRAILKDTYSKSSPLSVLIQSHFKNFSKYQITVITASHSLLIF